MHCRLDPVHVERVSIRDALGGLSGLKRGGFSSLWSQVELIEPTFQVNPPYEATIIPNAHTLRVQVGDYNVRAS